MSQEDDDKKKKSAWSKADSQGKSKILSQAADLAKTLANASGAKKYRDAGVDKGTPVEANEQMPKGMNVTVTDAYSTPRTGDDMGQMDPEKRKKKYGF
tara:strand:+ start:2758 stop:3051 length:294 start_codon:yes stop_codon:yes gene_type:complete